MDKPFNKLNQEDYECYLETLKEQFVTKYQENPNYKVTLEDYDIITTIGSGAFGEVYLVRSKNSFAYHAMKAITKKSIVENNLVRRLLTEKKVLSSVKFPFFIKLEAAFKDNSYIYFTLPFISGGEMMTYIQKNGPFTLELSQFYGSQVVLGVEYLHYCDVIHRDIKPENIFIDSTGYLKIGDFGLCKVLNKKKTWTLCGTPQYVAPELILSKGYSFSVDWWAVGVLIYEMGAGIPPFIASDPNKLYDNILEGQYKCPDHFTVEWKSLIKGLLQVDPKRRLGTIDKGGVFEIKNHPWFSNLNWQSILNQKVEPPFKPVCSSPGDTSNFPETTQRALKRSNECKYESEFADF